MRTRLKILKNFITVILGLLLLLLSYIYFGPPAHLKDHHLNPFKPDKGRGSIFDCKERVLAENVLLEGKSRRIYPYAYACSNLVGYDSPNLGKAGLEAEFNRYLEGKGTPRSFTEFMAVWAGNQRNGEDLVLTVDAELQTLAYQLLQGRRGAVVVLQSQTGAILALTSSPGFNPNTLESEWNALIKEQDNAPLINRALYGYYPPGSSFKIATATIGLENAVIDKEGKFTCSGSYTLEGKNIDDAGGAIHGKIDLIDALVYSCNSVFAFIGNKLTPQQWEKGIDRLTLNRPVRAPGLNFKPLLFPPVEALNDLERAQLGIGQGKLLATPMGMALLAEIIANRGWLSPPFILNTIKSRAKNYSPAPEQKLLVMTPNNAEFLQRVMLQVVQRGTGRSAALDGIAVAGKTGTAENSKGEPHSWFIGFAPAEEPQVVVAVLVENAGFGSQIAAPIAAEMLKAALSRK